MERVHRSSGQSGFTVLEVAIAGVIGAAVLLGAGSMMHTGVEQHATVIELQQQHHQLERFWTTTRTELGGSNLGLIALDGVGATGTQLTFQFALDHVAGGSSEFGADIEPIGAPVPADAVLDRASTPFACQGSIHKDANKKPGHLAEKAIKKRRDEIKKAREEPDPKKAQKHLLDAVKATKEKKWSVRYVVLEGEAADGEVATNLYRFLIDDKDKIQSAERVVEHVASMDASIAGAVIMLRMELANGDLLELQALPKN